MKKTTQAAPPSAPVLEKGQMWKLKDSNIQVGIIGKRLVHYKHFMGQVKRANNSLTSIHVLEKYLEDNQAVLVETIAPKPTALAASMK